MGAALHTLLVDAARPCRHRPGDRWFVDETYVKVAGRSTYLYRAVDQHGQVIDVLASERRDQAAARRCFVRALMQGRRPVEVTTDKAPVFPRVLDELLPEACHVDAARENNWIESDHGRLKARLRPMRRLKRLRSVQTISAGHALVQNVRRSHYELANRHPPAASAHRRVHRTRRLTGRSPGRSHAQLPRNTTAPARDRRRRVDADRARP